jgi:hypothetical protein
MMAGVVSLTGVVISFAPALANHLWQSTAFAAVAAGRRSGAGQQMQRGATPQSRQFA